MDLARIFEEIAATAFGFICHQDPAILAALGDGSLLICPRCFGLQVGLAAAYWVSRIVAPRGIRPTGVAARLILSLVILPMAVDWGLAGHLGLYAPTFLSRLTTGLATGSALGVALAGYRQRLSLLGAGSVTRLGGFRTEVLVPVSIGLGVSVILAGGAWGAAALLLRDPAPVHAMALVALAVNAGLVVHTSVLICRNLLPAQCWQVDPPAKGVP